MKQLGLHTNIFFKVEGEFVTFSTVLTVQSKQVKLTYTRLLSYVNLEKLANELYDEVFKTCFLHSEKSYTDDDGKMYTWIVESDYKMLGKWHELQWEEVNKK